jgi:hypothetical protein
VTGQGLRWAGMRTANRVRTPERAAAAERERAAALVQQVVEQLGQMRGAAMKVGQMLSMVEFDGLLEEEPASHGLSGSRDTVRGLAGWLPGGAFFSRPCEASAAPSSV